MQTEWLIDFLTLAETRSFSRAAQLRHVTQPAFSRRIRSLEAWAMTALVDRSRHPQTLTQAGVLLQAKAPELVAAMQHTHALLRGHTSIHRSIVRFAAPHALAFNVFPDWIHGLDATLDGLTPQMATMEAEEATKQLLHGECDLMLAYADADALIAFDPAHFEVLRLGQERLLPCARPDASGQPRHRLPGTPREPVPYLACAEHTVLGRAIERALKRQPEPPHLHRVSESDHCESLMAMALSGQGLAFLPERSVQAELARERLVTAGPPLSTVLDICLVRLRMIGDGNKRRTPIDAFWDRLQTRGTRLACIPSWPGAMSGAHRKELVEPA
jgi:DNA-binding transcriptional LysR family regulator